MSFICANGSLDARISFLTAHAQALHMRVYSRQTAMSAARGDPLRRHLPVALVFPFPAVKVVLRHYTHYIHRHFTIDEYQ
jgi:hypothetical protein